MRAEGLEAQVISAGSTPGQVTEMRPGTYLLGDGTWLVGARGRIGYAAHDVHLNVPRASLRQRW